MAIESGLAVGCADVQATGGTRHILIREWATGDTIGIDSSAGQLITKVKDTGGSTATWGVYESKIESSSLTITGGNEGNDTNTYECVLSFYLPRLSVDKMVRLEEFYGACLMCIIVDSDSDADYLVNQVIGISDKYRNQENYLKNQTYARLSSVEGGTGGAFSDDNGVTVTITCTQYELPRTYDEIAGAGITIAADGLTATTT